MATATDPFEDELAAAARLDMRANPFVAALVSGRATRYSIRRYGIAVYRLAQGFSQRLAAAASICDDATVRLALLENLLEEEGAVSYADGRLVADESKRHGRMARRFALAAGATDADLDAATNERLWLNDAVAQRKAAAVIAYLTVGIESNVPSTLALIADALARDYGFAADDLEFLTSHVAFDAAHGASGRRLVAGMVRSDADRAEAIDGARRGAVAWWWLHRSLVAS